MYKNFIPADEALAVLEGCLLARQENLTQVVMESDSLSIITWLKESISKATWEAFHVLTRVLDIGASMHTCRWSWIPRSRNDAADSIASHQVPKMRDSVWGQNLAFCDGVVCFLYPHGCVPLLAGCRLSMFPRPYGFHRLGTRWLATAPINV
ncbi:hypothetical protein ACFX11_012123 [Malus domestica]